MSTFETAMKKALRRKLYELDSSEDRPELPNPTIVDFGYDGTDINYIEFVDLKTVGLRTDFELHYKDGRALIGRLDDKGNMTFPSYCDDEAMVLWVYKELLSANGRKTNSTETNLTQNEAELEVGYVIELQEGSEYNDGGSGKRDLSKFVLVKKPRIGFMRHDDRIRNGHDRYGNSGLVGRTWIHPTEANVYMRLKNAERVRELTRRVG